MAEAGRSSRQPEACSGTERSLRRASWPKTEPACLRHRHVLEERFGVAHLRFYREGPPLQPGMCPTAARPTPCSPRALPGSNMIVWRARPPRDGTAAAAAAAAATAVPPSEWPSVGPAPWSPSSLHGDTNTDEMFIYTTILYLTQACACACARGMCACACATHRPRTGQSHAMHCTSHRCSPCLHRRCHASCQHCSCETSTRGIYTKHLHAPPSPPLPHTAWRRRRRWRDGYRRRGRPERPSGHGAARAAGSRPTARLLVRLDGWIDR